MSKTFKIITILAMLTGAVQIVSASISTLNDVERNNTNEIEVESIVERPEVISNIEEIYQMSRTEVYPDLSTSSFAAKTSQVTVGEVVHYTTNILNTGNVQASDIDIFIEIDTSFEAPHDLVFSGCGSGEQFDIEHDLEISNITVKKDNNCLISFDVGAKYGTAGLEAINALYISPAAEGGVEIGPINSSAVIIQGEVAVQEIVVEEIPVEPEPVSLEPIPKPEVKTELPTEPESTEIPEPTW